MQEKRGGERPRMKEVSTFHEHTGFARAARALSRHNAGRGAGFLPQTRLAGEGAEGLERFRGGRDGCGKHMEPVDSGAGGRGGLGRMVVPARDDRVLAGDSLPAAARPPRPPRPPGRRTGGAARVAPPVDDGRARRRAA